MEINKKLDVYIGDDKVGTLGLTREKKLDLNMMTIGFKMVTQLVLFHFL